MLPYFFYGRILATTTDVFYCKFYGIVFTVQTLEISITIIPNNIQMNEWINKIIVSVLFIKKCKLVFNTGV